MAKQTIEKLKSWFKTALKPTQQQFWDWMDSYWHKDEKIAINNVDGLTDIVNNIPSASALNAVSVTLNEHLANKENPHEVTKEEIGLGLADNTSDADKPVSIATQAAIESALETSFSNNVFYVNKKYTGAGAAIITGLRLQDISSTNEDYVQQLAKAKAGSLLFPYPCPYAARNAAMDAIAAGLIDKAVVHVMAGNSFTIGSDDATKNGDVTGNATVATVADCGFSEANSTAVASLLQNSLDYYFEQNTTVVYANSKYAIYGIYHSDEMGTVAFNSNFVGFTTVKQVYGQVTGFAATFAYINNPNAIVSFYAAKLYLQQYKNFWLYNVKSFTSTVDYINMAPGHLFVIGASGSYHKSDGTGEPTTINILVKNLVRTTAYFPYPVFNDFWPIVQLGAHTTPRQKNIVIRFDNFHIEDNVPWGVDFKNSAAPTGGWSQYNVNLAIQFGSGIVKRLSSNQPGAYLVGSASSSAWSKNSNFLFEFENLITDAQVIGSLNLFADNAADGPSSNSTIKLKCGNVYKTAAFTTSPAINVDAGTFPPASTSNKIVIEGNYYCEAGCSAVHIIGNNPNIKMLLNGIYKIDGPKPVINLTGVNNKVSLLDMKLVNDGTVNSINAVAGSKVFVKDTMSTAAVNSNLTQVGQAVNVVPELKDYL